MIRLSVPHNALQCTQVKGRIVFSPQPVTLSTDRLTFRLVYSREKTVSKDFHFNPLTNPLQKSLVAVTDSRKCISVHHIYLDGGLIHF